MNIDQKIDSQELGVSAYKGFYKDMTCRGFQYEEGKSYKYDGTPILCEKGFHACLEPLEVFRYYCPINSVFHRVKVSGDIDKASEGSKVAASEIEIGKEISPHDLAYAQIKKMAADGRICSGEYSETAVAISKHIAVSNGVDTMAIDTGSGIAYTHETHSIAASYCPGGMSVAGENFSMAVALGGDAATLGYHSVAATTFGHAYAGERNSVAAAGIGDAGVMNINSIAASTFGRSIAGTKNSVAITVNGSAAGAKGSYLIFAAAPLEGNMQIHTVYVDGEKVQANTFYSWNGVGNVLMNCYTHEVIDDYYTEEVNDGS